jgi:protein transport protein SEC20
MGRETVVHSSGTRGPIVVMSGQKAPTVKVGGGGKGGPMTAISTQQGDSVSEKVGKIIDESGHARVEDEGSSGEAVEVDEVENQPNLKKRMWKEEKEVVKEAEKEKDEL